MPTLVMIDDDKDMLSMVGSLMTAIGWGFSGAANGAMGLELLRRSRPDALLLDVHLPDIDGARMCERLKNDAWTRDIPILLISGEKKAAEDIVAGLGPAKADGYVLKPVSPMVLKAKLDAVLRAYKSRGGASA